MHLLVAIAKKTWRKLGKWRKLAGWNLQSPYSRNTWRRLQVFMSLSRFSLSLQLTMGVQFLIVSFMLYYVETENFACVVIKFIIWLAVQHYEVSIILCNISFCILEDFASFCLNCPSLFQKVSQTVSNKNSSSGWLRCIKM